MKRNYVSRAYISGPNIINSSIKLALTAALASNTVSDVRAGDNKMKTFLAQEDCGQHTFGENEVGLDQGPIRYSCRQTSVSHTADRAKIRVQFIGIACARGKSDDQAALNASGFARKLVLKLQAKYLKDNGLTGAYFIDDETKERCVNPVTGKERKFGVEPPDDEKTFDELDAAGEAEAKQEHEAALRAEEERKRTSATFIIHNQDRYALDMQFFSQTRRGYSWPGAGYHYPLAGTKTYNLNCQIGEKICYGAWRQGQIATWGIGHGEKGCTDCCSVCGETIEMTLLDGGPDRMQSRFTMHSRDRYALGLEFYSKNYGGAWPGNGKQYTLSGTHTFNLTCSRGEKICFGAWRNYQTVYWGVGNGGKEGCRNCCVTCGHDFETTLNDGGADSYPSAGGGSRSGVSVGDMINAFSTGVAIGNALRGSGGGYGGSGYVAPMRPPSGHQQRHNSDVTGFSR